LERKAELRKFFHEENSFYVCKIGAGNSFTGQAPGALQVIPAEKPIGNIDHILGSNFDEVREFAQSIESASKWHDLFKATSPSKTADKANVLLIGPQGCGKTEVMRAIGADKNSISIFAQGSDFETCWKGEAEKNPKRLFEEGLKLTRDSGKHVHFLIDEIDAVLNNDQTYSGKTNLSLEFQILMDGVVTYPNLSVWGATNNPHRIPMPMIRRFSKALVVGELTQTDRIKLLKMFLGRMPIEKNINDLKWNDWSNKLEGATGDVVRKVADNLWRKKMNHFVTTKSTDAESVLKQLHAEGPFSVEKFDREKFKATLAPHVSITAEDIERSVKETLSNASIVREIKTAVETYRAAKEFLDELE
jgi:SpoVK/Ycf46/Vps4 family AAA+-type ATPase